MLAMNLVYCSHTSVGFIALHAFLTKGTKHWGFSSRTFAPGSNLWLAVSVEKLFVQLQTIY